MSLCDRCRGACCEELILTLEPRDFFDHEFLDCRLEGLVEDRVFQAGREPAFSVRLPLRCPKLTHDGLCSVHGQENGQPTACRLAAVLGPECLGALRRLRPALWDEVKYGSYVDPADLCVACGREDCSCCPDTYVCTCNDTHTCEAHRA
jgi:hypothetical protein